MSLGFADFTTYCDMDGVNFSTLKEMAKSPLHYRHRCMTPREDTAGMRFGRAVHTAVLEPDEFPRLYVVYDGGRRAGKAWDEFEAANAGKTILKADEYDACLAVRNAVRNNADAARILDGDSEVSMLWTDDATGIACKGRVDHTTASVFVDLKSTSSVDRIDFARTVANMRYHAQLAFYSRGLTANGLDLDPRVIAVEVEPPYDVAVLVPDEDAMWAGERLIDAWLRTLQHCIDTDTWPGRYQAPQPLTLPAWAMPSDEEGWGSL